MTSGHNKISCVINDITVYYFKRSYRKYVNLCFRFHDTTSQGTNATYVGLPLTLKKNSSLVSFFFVTARKRIQASTAGFFRLPPSLTCAGVLRVLKLCFISQLLTPLIPLSWTFSLRRVYTPIRLNIITPTNSVHYLRPGAVETGNLWFLPTDGARGEDWHRLLAGRKETLDSAK